MMIMTSVIMMIMNKPIPTTISRNDFDMMNPMTKEKQTMMIMNSVIMMTMNIPIPTTRSTNVLDMMKPMTKEKQPKMIRNQEISIIRKHAIREGR